ncbi:hypothetical protein P5673_017934, partial [Acropora cervicornis]
MASTALASSEASMTETAVTWEQCSNKWKKLEERCKKIQEHNVKTGNDRKDMEFYEELSDFFGSDPKIIPCSSVSSMAANPCKGDETSSDKEDAARSEAPKKKRKRKSKSSFIFHCFLVHAARNELLTGKSSSEEELFLTQSTFTVKSDEYDGLGVPTREGNGKCLEDNAGISEGSGRFCAPISSDKCRRFEDSWVSDASRR